MSDERDVSQTSRDNYDNSCIFSELDANFSESGLSRQIHNLNKDKSPGIDGLINEMFVKYENVFVPIFTKLFSHILSIGVYQEE